MIFWLQTFYTYSGGKNISNTSTSSAVSFLIHCELIYIILLNTFESYTVKESPTLHRILSLFLCLDYALQILSYLTIKEKYASEVLNVTCLQLSLQKLHTAKQAVSPGTTNCMCPETASSDTPDSNQGRFNSLQAELIAMRASKLSTQLSTRSTGPPERFPWLSVTIYRY